MIGGTVNISAGESILTDGQVDYKNLDATVFDPIAAACIRLGEKAGNARDRRKESRFSLAYIRPGEKAGNAFEDWESLK